MRTCNYPFFKESGTLCSSLLHGFCSKNVEKMTELLLDFSYQQKYIFSQSYRVEHVSGLGLYVFESLCTGSLAAANFSGVVFIEAYRVVNASSLGQKAFCVQNFITVVTQLLQPCRAIQSSLPTRKRQTVLTSLCQQKKRQ